ncbi:hypothetical protein Aglo01_55340 [Actinokineospora globicatena]|nr:hypothetical protein Aglo01_55340 [Actinokineospora globicatena]GLW88246.1 hypothetical protein Aglo02_58850 [Actinokineospora globicatena]
MSTEDTAGTLPYRTVTPSTRSIGLPSILGGVLTLLLPGHGYTATMPLLDYLREATTRRGADVMPVTWPDGFTPERVPAHVAAILDGLAEPPLVIAKSLGTFSAGVVAERGLTAVWLTPVLTDAAVVAGIRANPAPALLVGGTADRFWDGELARSLSPHVLEVDGADHSMLVPGPMARSAAVLGQVCTAVEEFLDGH